jgi:hypothetical protein
MLLRETLRWYDDGMKPFNLKNWIVVAGTLLGAFVGLFIYAQPEGAVSVAGPSYYPELGKRIEIIKYVLAGAAIGIVVDALVNGLPKLKRFSLRSLMLAVTAIALACCVARGIWQAFKLGQ